MNFFTRVSIVQFLLLTTFDINKLCCFSLFLYLFIYSYQNMNDNIRN
uniref:Uncharacterized protein n=1 Tax=Rhizophora mucronata TaxID=61149 RepID=A0A2P2J4J4_RHIMU